MECQQMNAEVKLTSEKVIGAQLREKPLKNDVKEIYEQFCQKKKDQKQLKCKISEREMELNKLQENQHKCLVCEKSMLPPTAC